MEVAPRVLRSGPSSLDWIQIRSPVRRRRCRWPRSARYEPTDDRAGGQSPGAVRRHHHLVQPAAGRSRWATRSRRSTRPVLDIGVPASVHGSFQGTARAFQASLDTQPWLILAALVDRLHRARHPLRELRASAHHPVDPAVGRGRRAAGAAGLRPEFTIIALIGVILLIGIVKKNAIMMIDFALEAERAQGLPPEEAIYRGLPAALPADPDDHPGGDAGRAAAGARQRRGRGAAASRSASPSSAG